MARSRITAQGKVIPECRIALKKFVDAMHIQPHDRIVEIGCGHGVAASPICGKLATGHYVGIDRSPNMVAAATKRNAEFVSAGLATFVVATLESHDPGEQRFDKVLAMRVRLILARPDQAARVAEQ